MELFLMKSFQRSLKMELRILKPPETLKPTRILIIYGINLKADSTKEAGVILSNCSNEQKN